MDWRELEGTARDFLEGVALYESLPVDLELVAHCYGLRLVESAMSAVAGNVVTYARGPDPAQTRFDQAHELAHIVVRGRGYSRRDEERIADALAARMLLPDGATKRLMASCGGDLACLVSEAQVPWKVAAYRFTELWTSVVRVWDGRAKPKTRTSPWLERWVPLSSIERTDAAECRRTGEHIRRSGMSGTYYVGGPDDLVISAWDLDELAEAATGYI